MNERVVGGTFVALVLFGWFVWMLSRMVASVFHDLGMMFNAIGTATVSFLAMAWALAQLAETNSNVPALNLLDCIGFDFPQGRLPLKML